MSAISIPRVKKNIMKLDKKECESLVERLLDMGTAEEIKMVLEEFISNK
jgi:phosphotransferase system enzyme I (PtsI)